MCVSHPSTLDLPQQMTRRSLVAALHARPDWTLEQLAGLLIRTGKTSDSRYRAAWEAE